MNKYTLENKPNFQFGEEVLVDFGFMYMYLDAAPVKGKIVGKSSEHILDVWLIQFDRDSLVKAIPHFHSPYNTFAIQHTLIINNK